MDITNFISSKVIILKFFKDNPQFDYTIRDVVQSTGIYQKIARPLIIDMEKDGELVRVRFIKCTNTNFIYSYQLPHWLDDEMIEERDRNYNMVQVSQRVNEYRRKWQNNRSGKISSLK